MKKIFSILFCFLVALTAVGQSGYTISLLSGMNSQKNEIACGVLNGRLIVVSSDEKDLVNEYSWNARPVFRLYELNMGRDFSDWSGKSRLFSHKCFMDEGTASFDPRDSVIYFSTAQNFGRASGNRLKIYSSRLTESGWTEPSVLPFCNSKEDYAHPVFDAERNLMVFSSTLQGGYGGMDIWYIYKTESGWGQPVNAGAGVNTASNEIFPSVFNGDIYFSSNAPNGKGGYDLMRASGKGQWKTAVRLDEPFNSSGDDIMLTFLNEETMLLTSNRSGGHGGDDIYLIRKEPEDYEKHDYTARLECSGVVHTGAGIKATNAWNEVVIDGTTDIHGELDIRPLLLNRKFKVQLSNIDPSLYTECVMYILDENKNVVKEIRFNSFGFAILEMLPFNYSNLNLLATEDGTILMPEDSGSLLDIFIEGQLYNKQPGDVGKGEPITILDENGAPAALAFTNESGKFRFTGVKPETEYDFKLAEETAAKNILITDKGNKIILPILNAEAHYKRLDPNDAIKLVNEFNETIYVSPKDIFVINRIYYDYNSAVLTPESRMQLDKLEILVAKNDDLKLEMRSHTDSRGSADYNLMLSKKRAESAIKYLVSKGIDTKRFEAIGFGESELLNECGDGVPCSEPEHAINRRTEIRLFEE